MRRSKRADALIKTSRQSLKGHNVADELTSAWKGLAQSKAALRQIENKLEAGPGTGVLLESVLNSTKNKSLKKSHSKESQLQDHHEATSKRRGRCQHSPEKSSSRSPLRNCTQDNSVRHSVEFREPVASYREATPPPHPCAPSDIYSLKSVPESSCSSQASNSKRVFLQGDTGVKKTDIDLDSTHSSTLENMEVRYLNDQPALDTLRTNLSHSTALHMETIHSDTSLKAQFLQNIGSKDPALDFRCQGECTPSSSPGSASQRLENLRRHQPDDKLEKLKERIRKQRQHLEEAAEKEKLGYHLEQPIIGSGNSGTCAMPTVKVRKVATAPSAPIYKGFNSTETKIQTPDGKIWNEEEFHNLSREIYQDLSRQFAESNKVQLPKGERDQTKARKPKKPVRKVQKVAAVSDVNAKPVISPASWRDGQNLVKMVLSKDPRMATEEYQTDQRKNLKASCHRSSSDPHLEINQVCPQNTAKKQEGSEFHNNLTSSKAVQEMTPIPVSPGMSAEIKGMLDDLQLARKTEHGDRARPRSRRGSSGRQVRSGSGSRTRAPVSTWATTVTTRGCHSASPSNRSRAVSTGEPGQKKRHYDADSVRLYIAQQQEKRKRQQVEEKKAMREETEKRHQRLQELYKKQRDVAKTAATTTVAPAQIRLQETFTKLLLEGAKLEQGATQMRSMYQPSGESDKENIRLEQGQSPSSSDRSLNHPPISGNDLEYGEASSTQPEILVSKPQSVTSPSCSNEHLLSQLLRLGSALAASEKHTQRPNTTTRHSPTKTSRIEALKATATSLSSRIESEARKLAGEGFNYGLTSALHVDSVLAPRSVYTQYGDHGWSEMAVNTSNSFPNEDLVERILGTRSNFSGSGFTGQDFNTSKEKKSWRFDSRSQPHTSSAQHGSFFHTKRGLTNDVEINNISEKAKHHYEATGIEQKCPEDHINSDSISEGPLSEGSDSDGEQSPPHSTNAFRPIGHPGAVQHSVRKSHHRLSEFQKDAENYAALGSLHQESPKPAWEEFNKGSPLSVINIFTKSLQGNPKVNDTNVERNSPSAHLLPSNSYVADSVYGKDFMSPLNSGASDQKDFNSSSNRYDELLRRSSEKRIGGNNTQSSSCSTPGSSPHSKNSTKGSKISDQSDVTLVEEHRSTPSSEARLSESRKRNSKRSPEHSQATLGDISGLSHQSSIVDEKMSPPSRLRQSLNGSLNHSSSLESNSFSVPLRKSSPEEGLATNTAHLGLSDVKATGELQYSPAVLQQRLAAELHYLESIEESVRQLGDMERLMGVSVAQHESASLAQMLKAKQQQHEQELYELKIKTEREALETKLQMEENRQRVAQAHIELQEGLAATQKETLEGLQEATTKMMSQQAEASRYTADTARHIKEMTEMAHAQMMTFKHASVRTELRKENSHANYTDKAHESRSRTEDHQFTLNSYSDHSDSASFRKSGLSSCSEHKETTNQEGKMSHEPPNEKTGRTEGSISIEEEVPIELNESLYSSSIPSVVEEKGDTTSVATEYSHKFDESITEDEIEERSFRSLLPSEAHRRDSLDKKLRHHDESEEDGASHNSTPASAAHNMLKPQDMSSTFSGGQDSFSHFTMEMVRQYMRDEEVRLQHQSALLHLRQKALKEKTRAELAWLEHQKKKLRDKGEDDKMPPIKKKQRGLLLRLQQEQAEIKRLQEANKAARKERQLLLKQQEEIERMRSSTFKLKERLRCATTEAPSDTSLSEAISSNLDPDARSPSPSVSVSGSETSSIMQKLKKMRSQMDEKFLTKREQQLMQRRHHAEELLQWKQRLDQEEAEVRKMEKNALAAWDGQTPQSKAPDLSESEKDFDTSPSLTRKADIDASADTPESSIHTDVDGQDEGPVLPKYTSASENASIQSSPAHYTDDFTSVSCSPNRQKPIFKEGVEVSIFPSEPNSKDEVHDDSVYQMSKGRETNGSHTTKQSEPISDQSDIESRIKALREELKKRKFTAHQLKKEQKKRTKERLKAQEANLLKQLETYNDFIEKTKAELNQRPDSTPDTKSPMSVDHPSDNRSSFIKTPESLALEEKALPDRSRSPSMPSNYSDEDPPTVTTTQRKDNPDGLSSVLRILSKDSLTETHESLQLNIISKHDTEVLDEELKLDGSKKSEDEESKGLLKLVSENKMNTISECGSQRSESVSSVEDQSVDSRHPEMKKETPAQDKASPPFADGYYNTLDSSVGASVKELNLKPAAYLDKISVKPDVPLVDSPEEEIEEEIAEDLSGLSPSSDSKPHFTRVMDEQEEKQTFKSDDKSPVNSIHSASVTSPVVDEMPGFNIGDRVVVSGVQPGTLRFKGATSFANGFWAGIELDKSEGSNNGTYDGVLYFECNERHGIFAPPDKVTHLTDKFEMFTDTTEDDDSFNDDMSEDENDKGRTKETKGQKPQHYEKQQIFSLKSESGDKKLREDSVHLDNTYHKSQHHEHPIPNGKGIWDSEDMSPITFTENTEKVCSVKQAKTKFTNLDERSDVEVNHQLIISSDLKNEDGFKDKLGSFADKLLNNLVKDTVQQFAEIRKSKAKKIKDANDIKGKELNKDEEALDLLVDQKDGLPFFLTQEKEELSSPELYKRPESPVLGASGQEELAKRLAELELSRGLDEFGDDQDWFDEDFGLSSRREQQRLKQRQREAEEQAGHIGKAVSGTETVIGGLVPSPGDQQMKTPPRPELPHPMPPKLPEEPAMVVPHSAAEVEKMVQAAALEIWETFGLKEETMNLSQQQKPNPSPKYFGEDPHNEDQEAVCLRSYKKAVFDLTWEILQDIFAEDPNANQPQWVKPKRVKSSFQRVWTPGDISTVQEFVSTKVLKLYGLTKHQDQQTDWPKMLKFGRKKRDRVDNILVQELHEEESQWVNYDEDELFVKIQLADSIFDALLKDTADVLTQIYDKRSQKGSFS